VLKIPGVCKFFQIKMFIKDIFVWNHLDLLNMFLMILKRILLERKQEMRQEKMLIFIKKKKKTLKIDKSITIVK